MVSLLSVTNHLPVNCFICVSHRCTAGSGHDYSARRGNRLGLGRHSKAAAATGLAGSAAGCRRPPGRQLPELLHTTLSCIQAGESDKPIQVIFLLKRTAATINVPAVLLTAAGKTPNSKPMLTLPDCWCIGSTACTAAHSQVTQCCKMRRQLRGGTTFRYCLHACCI